jgi:ribosome-binding factor A
MAEEIRALIAEILQRDLQDPRLKMVTCTRVQLTSDLRSAKVYVSVLAPPEEQRRSLASLERAAGFVRRRLAQRLAIRLVPEVAFVFDPAVEYGIELERLLADARRQSGEPEDAETDGPSGSENGS